MPSVFLYPTITISLAIFLNQVPPSSISAPMIVVMLLLKVRNVVLASPHLNADAGVWDLLPVPLVVPFLRRMAKPGPVTPNSSTRGVNV